MSKVPYEVYTEEVEALSVLSPDGEIINKDMLPKLTDDQLKEIMYRMVFTRTWDDRAVNLVVKGVSVSMLRYPDKKQPWLVANMRSKKKTLLLQATAIFRKSFGMVCHYTKLSCIPVVINTAVKCRTVLMY